MKGIKTKWACPSCGNILSKNGTFISMMSGNRHSFDGPTKCGCGRRGRFTLFDFESLEVGFADKDQEIMAIPQVVAEETRNFAIAKIKQSEEDKKDGKQ